jgi:hypothetical protein
MADKEPVAKLPLAVRKNGTTSLAILIFLTLLILVTTVRDAWETEKPKFEEKISTMLGTAWTFDINPNAIFPYAEENSYASNSLGACIAK